MLFSAILIFIISCHCRCVENPALYCVVQNKTACSQICSIRYQGQKNYYNTTTRDCQPWLDCDDNMTLSTFNNTCILKNSSLDGKSNSTLSIPGLIQDANVVCDNGTYYDEYKQCVCNEGWYDSETGSYNKTSVSILQNTLHKCNSRIDPYKEPEIKLGNTISVASAFVFLGLLFFSCCVGCLICVCLRRCFKCQCMDCLMGAQNNNNSFGQRNTNQRNQNFESVILRLQQQMQQMSRKMNSQDRFNTNCFPEETVDFSDLNNVSYTAPSQISTIRNSHHLNNRLRASRVLRMREGGNENRSQCDQLSRSQLYLMDDKRIDENI